MSRYEFRITKWISESKACYEVMYVENSEVINFLNVYVDT